MSEFDSTFTRDRDRALDDMVSGKAGIPLGQARKILSFPVAPELTEKCPKCGKKLKLRMGKNGLFIACSGYPACTFTQNIPDPDEDVMDATELESTMCEECGSPMKLRQSRAGSAFLGCTAYPKCRNIVNVVMAGGKPEARPDEPTGEMCPESGHPLVRRHGRFGAYIACSGYPACKYKPPKPIKDTGVRCPKDGGLIADSERLETTAQLGGLEPAAEGTGEDVAGEAALGLAGDAAPHQLQRHHRHGLLQDQPLEVTEAAGVAHDHDPGLRRAPTR